MKAKTTEIGAIRDLLPSWRISLMARNLRAEHARNVHAQRSTMLADSPDRARDADGRSRTSSANTSSRSSPG